MAAVGIGPLGDQGSAGHRFGQRREAGAEPQQRAAGPQQGEQHHGRPGQAERQRPGQAEGHRCRPGGQQQGREQQQLGRQPPFAAAVVAPAGERKTPAVQQSGYAAFRGVARQRRSPVWRAPV